MEAVIFCGVQGAGKSALYRARFFRTHVRINLDMLRTRRREALLLRACLEAGQPFVVDNTNPTARERARYLEPARAAGFRAVGYFFDVPVEAALERNAARPEAEQVPAAAIRATRARLEPPSRDEGFAQLYLVRLDASGALVVEAVPQGEDASARER